MTPRFLALSSILTTTEIKPEREGEKNREITIKTEMVARVAIDNGTVLEIKLKGQAVNDILKIVRSEADEVLRNMPAPVAADS